MVKKYTDLFFDLDRTLWDFDRNSRETLKEIFIETGLSEKGISGFDHFIERYEEVNLALWDLYRRGEMSREVLSAKRFRLTLESFRIDDGTFAQWFGEEYLRRAAMQDHSFPGAQEIIEYLHPKYSLHILTNGFHQVQHSKLKRAGIKSYFKTILSSEEIGVSKPDPEIFRHALELAEANPTKSLMIGDDITVDILGAKKVGIDQVWFNPNEITSDVIPTYEIRSLMELRTIL